MAGYEPLDDGIKLALAVISTGALVYIAGLVKEGVNYLRGNYQETKALREKIGQRPSELENKLKE